MGAAFGFVMMVTAMITALSVREPRREDTEPRRGFFKTYLGVFGNRPYVLIMLTYALHITALTVVSGIAIYYFKYVHHSEALTTAAMVTLLVSAMLFIPVSVLVSKKLGKKATYSIGMVVFAGSLIAIFFLGHLYPPGFSIALMLIAGVGMGFTYAMPYAIVPDAIEYDYLRTGKRMEGAFYGIWTFAFKIGQALALGITGGVLSLTGYVPDVEQTASALLGIRLLLGPISAAIFLLALASLYFYPINEKRYNEILLQIEQRTRKDA